MSLVLSTIKRLRCRTKGARLVFAAGGATCPAVFSKSLRMKIFKEEENGEDERRGQQQRTEEVLTKSRVHGLGEIWVL